MNISVSLGICGTVCIFLFVLAPSDSMPVYFRYLIGTIGVVASLSACFLIGKEFLGKIISKSATE